MRDTYWAMYTALKDKDFYYRNYRISSHRINTWMTIFCAVMSVTSIERWLFWKQLPYLWAFLLAVSQIIQIIQPYMSFSKQVVALDYLLPELEKLMIDIEYHWNLIEEISDQQVAKLIHKYEIQYMQLDNKFIGSTHMPLRKRCQKAARKEAIAFFYQKYQINQEVENIEYVQ